MKVYGYIRVSAADQKTDRQLDEMLRFGVPKKHIYSDYRSGRDFERPNYKRLIKKLRKGDLLVIKSIDRLGRNYRAITDEWRAITVDCGADIKVLDMPLLDTRVQPENLVGRFISDLVLQILSFVAENERTNIRSRQAEGIAAARARGVHLGRPPAVLPEEFYAASERFNGRQTILADAAGEAGMRPSTFYKYARRVLRD